MQRAGITDPTRMEEERDKRTFTRDMFEEEADALAFEHTEMFRDILMKEAQQ